MANQTERDLEYERGYNRLSEHMRETHSTAGEESRIPSERESSVHQLAGGYERAIQENQEKGYKEYASAAYASGARDAVKEWEHNRLEELAPREKEQQTERIKAW